MAIDSRPAPPAFEFAPDGGAHLFLGALGGAIPAALKDRRRTAAPQVQPSRCAARIRTLLQKAKPVSNAPAAPARRFSLFRDHCTAQNRHRMLSNRFRGATTSFTRRPKFPFTSTTSPRATILSP